MISSIFCECSLLPQNPWKTLISHSREGSLTPLKPFPVLKITTHLRQPKISMVNHFLVKCRAWLPKGKTTDKARHNKSLTTPEICDGSWLSIPKAKDFIYTVHDFTRMMLGRHANDLSTFFNQDRSRSTIIMVAVCLHISLTSFFNYFIAEGIQFHSNYINCSIRPAF